MRDINQIHPTAIVADSAIIGSGNKIGAYSIIHSGVSIGNNNNISEHVVLGSPGQDSRNPSYDSSQFKVKIGNNNTIREFCSVQKPINEEFTQIDNNCFLMHGCHIAHDCLIQSDSTLGTGVITSGFVKILKGANIGIGVKIHQFSVIGQFAFIAMGSNIVKNIQPFAKYTPGPKSVNEYALKKFGFMEFLKEIEYWYIDGIIPQNISLIEIQQEYQYFHLKSSRNQL